eukprot:jgi/Galph1/1226/GphlegSOOS_G5964.1
MSGTGGLDAAALTHVTEPGTFVDILTVLLLLIVFFRWINKKTLNIPDSITLSLSAFISSNLVIVLNYVLPHLGVPGLDITPLHNVSVSFPSFVLDSALGFLLFADAMELDIISLKRSIEIIFVLAVFTTMLASFAIACFLYVLMSIVGFSLPFSHCLLFGAIVSPTDPVAVNGILKTKKDLLPKFQKFIITGEALFNDAVSVVLFIGLRRFISSPDKLGPSFLVRLFIQEVILGLVVGLSMGYLAYLILSSFESRILEAHVTLVLVLLINMLCKHVGASIPLASVVAGLMIGNYGVAFVISSQKSFNWLWGFISDTLNSILYLLIGFISILFVTLPDLGNSASTSRYYFVCIFIIPLSLLSRFISVFIPLHVLKFYYKLRNKRLHPAIRYAVPLKFIFVLTWSGMRGAISVALALSLSAKLETRDLIFTLCYILVCFSTIVQGLLFEKVVASLSLVPIRQESFGKRSASRRPKKEYGNKGNYSNINGELKPLPSLSDLIRSVGLMEAALNKVPKLPTYGVVVPLEVTDNTKQDTVDKKSKKTEDPIKHNEVSEESFAKNNCLETSGWLFDEERSSNFSLQKR